MTDETKSNWEEDRPNEDDFTMSGEGIAAGDLGGGGTIDKEGWYHFEIDAVVLELEALSNSGKERTPRVRMDMTVIHSVKDQSPEGSKYFHSIYVGAKGGGEVADGSRNSAFRFGLGLGILRDDSTDARKKIVDVATGSEQITMKTWKLAMGCQCIARIVKEVNEKYNDRYQIPFGRVYLPSDPHVKDIPKNMEAWGTAPNHLNPVSTTGDTNVSSVPVETSSPVSDMDDLSDL